MYLDSQKIPHIFPSSASYEVSLVSSNSYTGSAFVVAVPWGFMFYRTISITHCGLATPYGDIYDNWVNTGSGNDLLPDGNKSLPEPLLTDLSSVRFSDIHMRGRGHFICQSYLSHQSLKLAWKLDSPGCKISKLCLRLGEFQQPVMNSDEEWYNIQIPIYSSSKQSRMERVNHVNEPQWRIITG